LNRESRVTESQQEIVDSIPYICGHYTYVCHLSSWLFYCFIVGRMFYKNVGRVWRVSDCEELGGVTHRRWWGWFWGVSFSSYEM